MNTKNLLVGFVLGLSLVVGLMLLKKMMSK